MGEGHEAFISRVGEVPADVVWDGVGDEDVLEAAGGDLVVVIWVAPTSNPVKGGVGKDSGMIEIRGICFCVN